MSQFNFASLEIKSNLFLNCTPNPVLPCLSPQSLSRSQARATERIALYRSVSPLAVCWPCSGIPTESLFSTPHDLLPLGYLRPAKGDLMKKVLLALAFLFSMLLFPVTFLLVGPCSAELRFHQVRIQFDSTVVPSAWAVVNPESVGLPDPTHFLVAD